MKIINYILFVMISLFAITSCESDIDEMTVNSPTVVKELTLTAEGNTIIVPNFDNLKEYPTILNWSKALMGSTEIPVTYTILVDTSATFNNPIYEAVGTNVLSKSLTNTLINDWGISFSVDPANPKPLDLFVKIAGSVYTTNSAPTVAPDSVYSNFSSIHVTPFLSEPAVVYIAGDYMLNEDDKAPNNWSPATSPKLYSATRNNIYVGYVYLNTEFKVCPLPGWDKGELGGANGTLEGANNIKSTPGFYWMEVDWTKKTYKITPAEISIIGSIYGDWGIDLKLIYDVNKNVLSVTETFVKGEFKFRQDKDWAVQFGLGSDGNMVGKMSNNDPDPSNIKLEESGELTITLDLWNYLKPTYSVKSK